MNQPDTRDRLIEAAAALFAEEGFWGASLRTITERAGANLAAVSYHFGGKEGLLEAVVQRAIGAVNAERLRRLAVLERMERPGVRDLVRAMVDPCFDCADPGGFAAFFGILARVEQEVPEALQGIMQRRFAPVLAAFRSGLARVLPDMPPVRLELRLAMAAGAFMKSMMVLSGCGLVAPAANPPAGPDAVRRELIAFLEGGLTAADPELAA
ncbi:MAG: TetR/AcrR family transcriptional regulator [Planctomycetota bacterium]